MSDSRQHRFARPALRKPYYVAAGVALVGTSVIAVTPVTAPLPGAQAPYIHLMSNDGDDVDMVLDFVRHGQSTDNVSHILGTTPPGAALTDLGKEQAVTVGESLYNNGDNDIDGVYASEFLRTQQTAFPLVQLLHGAPSVDPSDIPDGPTPLLDQTQILAGLNELSAGTLDGAQQTQQTGLEYLQGPLQWIMGNYLAPQLGSTVDPNGVAFDERFTDAVDTIYKAGGPLSDGELHDVAFSHAAAITTWMMMNVKNPDFELYSQMLRQGLLPNTGQIVIEGNPTDGWTLVSYDGVAVPQDPGLATELFVDYRDLITAPQIAYYNISEAIAGGDPTAILNSFTTGFDDVGAAVLQFPGAVTNDIVDSIQNLFIGFPIIAPEDAVAMATAVLG